MKRKTPEIREFEVERTNPCVPTGAI